MLTIFGLCSARMLLLQVLLGNRPNGLRDPVVHNEERIMAKNQRSENDAPDTAVQKDPDTWTTGDESMTASQASYLETLSQEAGEEMDPSLTKAEASKRIDELQERTGRGRDH